MPVDKRYTAEVFKKKLPRRHSRGYIAIPELRVGCGYAAGAERSIDLWVIEPNATSVAHSRQSTPLAAESEGL